jgi:hypothetical protein
LTRELKELAERLTLAKRQESMLLELKEKLISMEKHSRSDLAEGLLKEA